MNEKESDFIQKVDEVIDANLDNEKFGLKELCKAVFTERTYLFRKMKALTGQAPSDYLRNARLNKAGGLLRTGKYSVGEVAAKTGFCNQAHFSKVFKKRFGVSPKSMKRNFP